MAGERGYNTQRRGAGAGKTAPATVPDLTEADGLPEQYGLPASAAQRWRQITTGTSS